VKKRNVMFTGGSKSWTGGLSHPTNGVKASREEHVAESSYEHPDDGKPRADCPKRYGVHQANGRRGYQPRLAKRLRIGSRGFI
jgi:hypothetical protein